MQIYQRSVRSMLWLYKALISPVFGSSCRYMPTCSQYAAAVLTSHGPVSGTWLAARRICRCHPLGGSGYDPPPAARPMKCDA